MHNLQGSLDTRRTGRYAEGGDTNPETDEPDAADAPPPADRPGSPKPPVLSLASARAIGVSGLRSTGRP